MRVTRDELMVLIHGLACRECHLADDIPAPLADQEILVTRELLVRLEEVAESDAVVFELGAVRQRQLLAA